MTKVAIVGTVGVPSNYGGFETLADNLIRQNAKRSDPDEITIYCSARAYAARKMSYFGARLIYLPFKANGAQSLLYDIISIADAIRRKNDIILLLGHGGSFVIPLARLFSKARFITNIDGIEWQRKKWTALARCVLRLSEASAVRFSHEVISDNEAIREYVHTAYAVESTVIAYGGDHAFRECSRNAPDFHDPKSYALALCRIEPENNVEMILKAFSRLNYKLIFVGNWNRSTFGRNLREKYAKYPNISCIDPIYDGEALMSIRAGASVYVHGHSAGGTNPALVEMMHFGIPIFAHDNMFNRYTTENSALFFRTFEDLCSIVTNADTILARESGALLARIARRRYTWDLIGHKYFSLFLKQGIGV